MNRWLLVAASIVFLAGCGPSLPRGTTVTGKITKGGAPLTIPGQQDGSPTSINLTIAATAPGPDGNSPGGGGQLDTSGSFRIVVYGIAKGAAPGKFRVIMTGNAGPGDDYFGGAYNAPNYVKEFEIPGDKVGGAFDLGAIELNDIKPAP